MGRSFFSRPDAELLAGSRAFAGAIQSDPESYGLSAEIAAQYQAVNDTYAACYAIAVAPGTRTKSTVINKNEARAELRKMASALARQINGTPGITNGQRAALGLSVPGAPTAVAELGKPRNCSFTLEGTGALRLKWKCTNRRATGTVYLVSRQIQQLAGERTSGADAGMKLLGVSRKRWFVDQTVPAGASEMLYQVQAVRSTAVGVATLFNVSFGVSANAPLPMRMAGPAQIVAA